MCGWLCLCVSTNFTHNRSPHSFNLGSCRARCNASQLCPSKRALRLCHPMQAGAPPPLCPLCSRDRSVSRNRAESMSFHFQCDTVNKFRMEPRDHESGLCSGNCTLSSGAGGLAWPSLLGNAARVGLLPAVVTVATGKSAS